jgi:hypothetical protein
MQPINWTTAIGYANLVAIAESVNPAADYAAADIASIQALGYKFLQTIYGDALATDINPNLGKIVTFGFLAVSAAPANELVAIVRGTETIWDWMHDAAFLMVPSPIAGAHGFTEDGFTAVYRSLRAARDNGSPRAIETIRGYLANGTAATVTVSGHSLGGSLATLLSLDVAMTTTCKDPLVYTFASPRTGDHFFAGTYNAVVPNCYRVANRQDLVPQLPPYLPLPYEHVNTFFELAPPPNAINSSIPCMHHLTTYLWLMARLANVPGYPLIAACSVAAIAPQIPVYPVTTPAAPAGV